jgi:2-polyprenyl-3-methyl-5-hydroxy-6-metoxy-1,4-benzoquinol methylase
MTDSGAGTQAAACAVCGAVADRELLQITQPDRFERHLGISADGYVRRWIECSSCGAATNVYQPGIRERLDELAAGYYEVDFAGSSIADKFDKIVALPPEKSDNAQRVERILAFLRGWRTTPGQPRRVLDIGAGTGVFLWRFLELAGREGWSGTSVEPDPIAAAHLRQLRGFEVVESVFNASRGLKDFDLVTLNKVVEHLADPVALLREAATALRPAGVMYVEVPDKLTAQHRAPNDNILGALHCHLYDPASVAILLSRAGLMPLRVERVFDPSGKLTIAAFATLPSTFAHMVRTERPA